MGPPGSGKSFLAKQLAAHYKLPHVHMGYLIKSTLDRLNNAVAALENPDVSQLPYSFSCETERHAKARESACTLSHPCWRLPVLRG
jgi:cytidylate kinase